MKKHLLLFALGFIALCSSLRAQVVTNTYVTGFDNTTEQAGWTQYRTGDNSLEEFNYTTMAYSTPTCLYHDYPVGGSVPTIDWFVSPVFDLSAGGTIDSIRCAFGGFGTPAAGDTVALVLLNGSQDPTLATSKTLLFDFRGSDYVNDNTWRKFSNISIPATNGPGYIAIKYRTIINWLDVRVDNISISSSHTGTFTGISHQTKAAEPVVLFPNLVERNGTVTIKQNGDQKEKLQLKLFNILGGLAAEKLLGDEQSQVSINQPAGTYIYQITTLNGALLRSGKLIVQ